MTWSNRTHPDTICLFDVDGTLTPARRTVSAEMMDCLKWLKQHCIIGFVGGSDLVKQREQLGEEGLQLFDYMFAENGLQAFKDGKSISSTVRLLCASDECRRRASLSGSARKSISD